jgi:hypothetical protein
MPTDMHDDGEDFTGTAALSVAALSFGGDGGDGRVGTAGSGAADSLTGTPAAGGDGTDTPGPDPAGGGGGGGAGATGGNGGAGGLNGGGAGAGGQPGVDVGNGVGGGGHASAGTRSGGGGGAGGAHGYVGASLPTSAASGQNGGDGGDGAGGGGGGGGAGGHGAVVTGSGALGTLNVNITGGAGGAGGRGFSSSGVGEGGQGGDAGYGLVFESSLAKSVTINSTILVQSPGPGEAGSPPGDPGSEAYAIVGENLDITLGANARIANFGLDSIRFTGGTNALELQAGATVSGAVAAAASTAATLRLGGTADASFDLDSLGVQYLGFDTIRKVGTGTWTVSGWMIVPRTWLVDAGTLQMAGATLGSALLTTVNASATLAGTGSIGALNVVSGGTLSPGAGSFSTGNLALAAGATYRAEINGPTPGSGYDQVNVSGTVALGGATLNLSVDAAVAPGTVFTILQNNGIDAISGTFAGLAEGTVIDAGKARFTIGYAGGDGNDVVLTALPRGTAGNDSFTAQAGRERIDALGGVDSVTFGFRLIDATVTYVGNTVVIDGPSSHTVLTGVERYLFTDGTVETNDGQPLIDDLFYYARNHDVWNAHVDADFHYSQTGWQEGRDPNAFFDISLYLAAYPDAAGADPLLHFDTIGWSQGRAASLNFGAREYLAANPDVAAAHVDPLWHFLAHGASEGRQPIAPTRLIDGTGFDFVYYLASNPDVAAAGVDPQWHFQTIGWTEGRNPNALFDTAGYLATYADVAAASINPLHHYNVWGWKEGRDPSVDFDTVAYLAANPDVAAANVNPLRHFLHAGEFEGRSAFADGVWG